VLTQQTIHLIYQSFKVRRAEEKSALEKLCQDTCLGIKGVRRMDFQESFAVTNWLMAVWRAEIKALSRNQRNLRRPEFTKIKKYALITRVQCNFSSRNAIIYLYNVNAMPF